MVYEKISSEIGGTACSGTLIGFNEFELRESLEQRNIMPRNWVIGL